MSDFVVVCGQVSGLDVAAGEFVAASDAQPYVTRAIAGIANVEAGPFYLWDDRESGTSSHLIGEAVEAFHERMTIAGTSLHRLLSSAQDLGASVYIWWAGNSEPNLEGLPRTTTLDDALKLIDAQLSARSSKQDIELAFVPVRPSRP